MAFQLQQGETKMPYDKNGWLFPSPDYKPNNDVHVLTNMF